MMEETAQAEAASKPVSEREQPRRDEAAKFPTCKDARRWGRVVYDNGGAMGVAGKVIPARKLPPDVTKAEHRQLKREARAKRLAEVKART